MATHYLCFIHLLSKNVVSWKMFKNYSFWVIIVSPKQLSCWCSGDFQWQAAMIGDASISSMTKIDIPRDVCGAFSLFPYPFLRLYRINVDYWTFGKKKPTTTKKRNEKKKRKSWHRVWWGSREIWIQGNGQFCPTFNETPCEACLFVVLLGGCLINQVTSHFECFLRIATAKPILILSYVG